MPEFRTIAKVGDIPENEARTYEYQDRVVAVFLVDGQYMAIDDMCPHMGASLASGHFEDCVVTCPWHAWSFDVRDGAWKDNPRVKIDTYRVRVVDEEIQIAGPEKDFSSESEVPESNPGG